MSKLKIESRGVSDLIPYAANSRTHSDAQVAQIAASIKEFGWTNPILIDSDDTIIAGHGRLLAARKLGMEEIPVIILDHLSKAQQRALVIADNQLALNAGWDMEMLKAEIEGLKLDDFNLDLLGFSDEELKDIIDGIDENAASENEAYSTKIDAPIYEITGKRPSISEMVDTTKRDELLAKIEKATDLPEDIKAFLVDAAQRHIRFNYENIAEFYAHSSKECQELMEDSALVIIDFEKAIENGFVILTETMDAMFRSGDEDDDEQ